jgi:hypothetical protein
MWDRDSAPLLSDEPSSRYEKRPEFGSGVGKERQEGEEKIGKDGRKG